MNSLEQLKLESFCASKIRYESNVNKRLQAYTDSYREFFSSVSDHPQFNLPDTVYSRYSRQLIDKIAPLISTEKKLPNRILELGCGRGFLIEELASRYSEAECVGVDVALDASDRNGTNAATYIKANILQEMLLIRDADLVIADQVLEHFHKDDVDQFISTCSQSTRSGGFVFIGTPNRVWGPHDISGVFRLPEPIGFHLKEYNGQEVIDVCLKHGLKFEHAILMLRERGTVLDFSEYLRLEKIISTIPAFLRHFMREKRLLGWANIRFLFRKI